MPSAVTRATAVAPLTVPPSTMRPCASIATALASQNWLTSPHSAVPSPEKLLSRLPSAR